MPFEEVKRNWGNHILVSYSWILSFWMYLQSTCIQAHMCIQTHTPKENQAWDSLYCLLHKHKRKIMKKKYILANSRGQYFKKLFVPIHQLYFLPLSWVNCRTQRSSSVSTLILIQLRYFPEWARDIFFTYVFPLLCVVPSHLWRNELSLDCIFQRITRWPGSIKFPWSQFYNHGVGKLTSRNH